MKGIQINTPAPEFSLNTFSGESIKLSNWKGKKNVILVFNRGFT